MKSFLLVYLSVALMLGHTAVFAEEKTILFKPSEAPPVTTSDQSNRAELILSGGAEHVAQHEASDSVSRESDQTKSSAATESSTLTKQTMLEPDLTVQPADTTALPPATLPETVLLNSEQDSSTPQAKITTEKTPVVTIIKPIQTPPPEETPPSPIPTVARPFESKRTKKTERVYDYIVYEAQNPDWIATNPNPYTADAPWILVGVRTQTMKQFDSWGRLEKQYPVSTAKRGVGEVEDSYQTPRGHHKICERIGDNLPARTIFSRRQATEWRYSKELHEQYPKKDWILTRILWLCGQEEGKNKGYNSQGRMVDSYKRYIYIHGSGDHAPFGVSPSSLGCVRMISEDVIDVFNQTKLGTDVVIEENQ